MPMKIIKLACRVFTALFFCVCIIGIAKGYQLLTDGFRLDKISKDLSQLPEYNLKISKEDKQKALDILDQDFKYLDKGCQTYVFESQDKQYVLKFVRFNKYVLPFWVRYIRGIKKGNDYYIRRFTHRTRSFKNTLKSYVFSYEKLKDQTGTIYVHLNKTNDLNKNVKISDRFGRSCRINLDNMSFMLQKKAKKLTSVMQDCVDNKDDKYLKELMVSFLKLVDTMYGKKIINKDYNCVKNSGVYHSEVVGIDLGSFFDNDQVENPAVYEFEMRKFVKHFRKWIIKRAPEKINQFDELVEKTIKLHEKKAS
jgi:hypothetical protein